MPGPGLLDGPEDKIHQREEHFYTDELHFKFPNGHGIFVDGQPLINPALVASEAEAIAGVNDTKTMTPAKVRKVTPVATDSVTSRTIIGSPDWTQFLGDPPTGTVVMGGSQSNFQRIGAVQLCVIGGGYDNEITQGIATTMAGGAHHVADAPSGHIFIGGGSTQKSHGSYGVNVGGLQNETWQGSYLTCGGGRANSVGLSGDSTKSDATVGGGYLNVASGTNSGVATGRQNQATSDDASISGGRANTASGVGAAVGGGTLNTASGATATIPGGTVCVASGASSLSAGNQSQATNSYAVAVGFNNVASGVGSVAFGRAARASLDSQFTIANSTFSVAGDAQTSILLPKRQTTNAIVGNLGLSGIAGSGPMVMPDNTTWAFSALVIARRTDVDGESAAYRLDGCIKRDTGVASTALVGMVTQTVIAETTAAWDAVAVADTVNGALKINVTGEAAKTINWVARVELTEVVG